MKPSKKWILLVALALIFIILDQWTKYWVTGALTTRFDGLETTGQKLQALYSKPEGSALNVYNFRPKRHITVSERFFRIRYAENPGAAWGMFGSLPMSIRGPLFHVVSLIAVLVIVHYYRGLSGRNPSERWALYGLPLVLGGALGNYIDRIARGFVIDFLEAHWMDKAHWPSFNVADSAICVGVGMLVVDAFVRREKASLPSQA